MISYLPKAPYRPPKATLFSFVPREDISAEVEGDFMPIPNNGDLIEIPMPYAADDSRTIISGRVLDPGIDWD